MKQVRVPAGGSLGARGVFQTCNIVALCMLQRVGLGMNACVSTFGATTLVQFMVVSAVTCVS